jgi:hypothetical protein
MSNPPIPISHSYDLARAYHAVGDRTWDTEDFVPSSLARSRDLFTDLSLIEGKPIPKALEVLPLVSGLPFAPGFVGNLTEVQRGITSVLGDRLHYWVAPHNLAVEYCVFKWPGDPWDPERVDCVRQLLGSVRHQSFEFEVRGIQVNPDGCVVAKGFDERGGIFRVREDMKARVPFLPERQSGWSHVPLGRILEPLGHDSFAALRTLIDSISDRLIASTHIGSMKLVHEEQWYMEQRSVLAEYALVGRRSGRTSTPRQKEMPIHA